MKWYQPERWIRYVTTLGNGMPQVRHPQVFVDKDVTPLELFSKEHPEYGAGNIQQINAD